MMTECSTMIEGVILKNLRVLTDERGFLMEMLRNDDPFFEQFGQVYLTAVKYGVAKGWHYHEKQTDHFVCVQGKALVVLYDARQNSPTYGEVNEFYLEEPGLNIGLKQLLRIPIGVIHGFTCSEGEEARLINIPTQVYNYKNPDELRYPWNAPEIPYHWPEYVKSGG